jgi:hypothetical protein
MLRGGLNRAHDAFLREATDPEATLWNESARSVARTNNGNPAAVLDDEFSNSCPESRSGHFLEA